MTRAVLDTHALVWSIFEPNRLSATARTLIETAIRGGDDFAFSTISLVEMVYLAEKGRIPSITPGAVVAMVARGAALVEVPVDLMIAVTLASIDRKQISDMPDRIIAATTLVLGVPLITADSQIRASAVPTIW